MAKVKAMVDYCNNLFEHDDSLGQGSHLRSAKKCSDLGCLLKAERIGLADRTERKTGQGGNGNRRFQPVLRCLI